MREIRSSLNPLEKIHKWQRAVSEKPPLPQQDLLTLVPYLIVTKLELVHHLLELGCLELAVSVYGEASVGAEQLFLALDEAFVQELQLHQLYDEVDRIRATCISHILNTFPAEASDENQETCNSVMLDLQKAEALHQRYKLDERSLHIKGRRVVFSPDNYIWDVEAQELLFTIVTRKAEKVMDRLWLTVDKVEVLLQKAKTITW